MSEEEQLFDNNSDSASEDFNFREALSDSSEDSEDEVDKHHKRKRVELREQCPTNINPSKGTENTAPSKMPITPFKTNYDDCFNEQPLKRPSTPPPYFLGKRPAFSTILQDLPPQAQEAPVIKKAFISDGTNQGGNNSFQFIDNYKRGIPVPPPPKGNAPDGGNANNNSSGNNTMNKNLSIKVNKV